MKTALSISFITCLIFGMVDLAYLNFRIIPRIFPEKRVPLMHALIPTPPSETPAINAIMPAEPPASDSAWSDAPDKPSETVAPAFDENPETDDPAVGSDRDSVQSATLSGLAPAQASVSTGSVSSPIATSLEEEPLPGKSVEATTTEADMGLLSEIMLQFEPGRFDLPEDQKEKLIHMLSRLEDPDQVWVRIDGHTDRTGKKNNVDNSLLSRQRADFVAAIVEKEGFSINRIIKLGYGASAPLDKNNNPTAWATNRRAVVQIYSGRP